MARIGILIAGLWYWTGLQPATEINSDIVLFYGRECPHCQDVEKFLAENKIAEKVKFNQLEVFRQPDEQVGLLFGFLTLGQIFSLIIIGLALLFLGLSGNIVNNKNN